MNSRNQEKKGTLVTRRDDPGYSQVSGYIPKELALRFKVACTEDETTQSEGLEEAVQLWLEKRERTKRNRSGGS
ncbi:MULTISPECIES: hypothetical protein [Aerosakkonema]|uniref:hypothetical protein n=1 Tax=Aerosakkonema TaxID=1246629 RepID=UPI0035B9E8C0